jgi:tetratricopeptide (TPR) repeat protein
LLNVLAQIPELRVAARTSAFSFKGQKVSVDSIARALNVAHVLEGSVRSSGDRVRITAQLIDARNGFHVWSESYDRELKDVFAVQDEITKAIVAQLRLKLSGGTQLARQETSSAEAHSLMLKGVATRREGTREALAEGQKLFEQAIALDSSYARAYAQLGSTLMVRANYRHIPLEAGYARARAAAERALEIDPKLSEAHTVLGRIADTHDWDFAKAETHFRRALELNPGDARAYSLHAWLLMRLGKVDASLAAARRSVELDPVSSPAYNNLGAMYSYAGKSQLAVDASQASLALTPENMSAQTNLALTYSDLGNMDRAIRTAEEAARNATADAFTQATLGYIYGKAGRKTDAEKALASLQRMEDSSPYLVATVFAGMGDKERAFDALERAVKAHDDLVPDLGVDPVFHHMRSDPRMLRLLKMIGLPTQG